jgi:quinolinate synthase
MSLPLSTALPMAPSAAPRAALSPEEIERMQQEVRALAAERGAVILAHNYQVPEVQDVADYVGDSLGLSRRAAAAEGATIVFCGVHFMAETASILCPEKTVLIPDLDAGCSLAASIDFEQLRAWKAEHPEGVVVMYVNTTAEVKALTDYCCTSANAVQVVRHIYETHGADTEILFGPDMWLGAYVEKELGRRMHVWDGECHVHAGIRPADIEAIRAAHPGADLLIHPEYAQEAGNRAGEAAGGAAGGWPREAVVATEVGMLHPLRMAAPDVDFIPANPEASCMYMKMITLPKLRDALREMQFEVRVPAKIAERARVPIDRMVAIG